MRGIVLILIFLLFTSYQLPVIPNVAIQGSAASGSRRDAETFTKFGTCYAQEGVTVMKKVVMVIAQDDFRDEELLEPKEILERNGVEVKIASTTLNQVKGMLGAKVKPDLLISDINTKDFEAIVFVGGVGASQYWNDPVAHKLVQEAVKTNRIVAAICIAPVTLARAGILAGKRATVFSSEAGQLKAKGVNYTGKAVEKDGNIITANGPSAAREFGEELARALK